VKVVKTEGFKAGENVPRSGVYRVSHEAHRLMHEAALLAGEQFPCCRNCGNDVRFELLRIMHDSEVLPFRSGEILQMYPAKLKKSHKIAG